jgi:hypothetical protein
MVVLAVAVVMVTMLAVVQHKELQAVQQGMVMTAVVE